MGYVVAGTPAADANVGRRVTAAGSEVQSGCGALSPSWPRWDSCCSTEGCRRIDARSQLSPTASARRGEERALDGLLHDGPGAGLFIVRAVPAEDASDSHDPPGAQVLFRASHGGLDDEEIEGDAAVIALPVGPGRPRYLEAVTVRRDTSARWAAGRGDEGPDPPAWSLVGADPGDPPERTADEVPEWRDPDIDIGPDPDADPEFDPPGWPWEAAILGPAGDRDAAGDRPPPDGTCADP